jgi:aminoglycoside 6'-N-acetyltransferase I
LNGDQLGERRVGDLLIEQATRHSLAAVTDLASQLWPDHEQEELTAEFAGLLAEGRTAVYLAIDNGRPVAFAQCSIRRDYVEGTEGGPVGYLEGIFVLPEHRRTGVARTLIRACESWSRVQGCRQMASDCALTNDQSRSFHLSSGFTEVNRIICFVKAIE